MLVGEAQAQELAGVVGDGGEPGGVGDEAAGVEAPAVRRGSSARSAGRRRMAMALTEMRPASLPSPSTGGIRASTTLRFSRASLSPGAAKSTASK